MATSYPGVATASDQNNAIVVRGNSPNGLLWRLNGLDIVNPNHLSNAGTLSDKPAANGGGVNILSAQMLGRTQFLLGALPTQYGNATAGVIDMQLRDGNREQREYTAQASLIGLDLAAEGPLSKNKSSSYLANYRYSTVGLLSAMGVDFGGEAISSQDFSFNLSFQNKKGGKTSIFGLSGLSSNKFNAKETADREQDKDYYNIDYAAQAGAVGVTHEQVIGGGHLAAGVSYSGSSQDRDAELEDSKIVTNDYAYDRQILSGFFRFTHRLGETSSLDLGANVSYSNDNYYDYTLPVVGPVFCPECLATTTSGGVSGILLQPYLNLVMDVSDKVT
ncbi:MAG: TonB-dependent receptor, partial [Bacteroidia bacterium]|nr:TonB-dependent receptor [Bacteroidia bacterium]